MRWSGRKAKRNPSGAKLHPPVLAFALGAAGLALALVALAQDPPHWTGAVEQLDCTSNCHVPHQALGGGLNPQTGNVNLCLSCHSAQGTDGRPITQAQKANPTNRTGTSHAFDVSASAGLFGTVSPTDLERSLRVQEGKLVCSTCHNQHKSEAAYGGRSRVSGANIVVRNTGTGALTSGGQFTGAEASWYLIEITVAGAPGVAKFGYSKDNGTSWFPSNCVPGGDTSGCLVSGTDVALDSGVTVTLSGGDFGLGERWEFYAAWPFLRRTPPLAHSPDVTIDSGAITGGDNFCRDCHASWVMTHNAGGSDNGGVRTWASGKTMSHPVGVGLNANSKAYDRAAPLDGNGAPQGDPGADANDSNDLQRDQFGNVQCLTCHGVHYADSNTNTVDGP